MFITRSSQAEHAVGHGHEISAFLHGLECIMLMCV